MRRYPSVDTIERGCGVDRKTAIKIRRLMDGRDDPREASDRVERLYRYQTLHGWKADGAALEAINDTLGTFGVEAIRTEHGRSFCAPFYDVRATYCNTGDSYGGTVLYDTERETFYVTSWADWVERCERSGRYRFE